jgi:hypothetical protein
VLPGFFFLTLTTLVGLFKIDCGEARSDQYHHISSAIVAIPYWQRRPFKLFC